MQDIRFAIRGLRKQPIFAIVAIVTLTLGIGANTAIFSLVYQTLLAPLPYAHADRLVFVWNTYPLTGLPQASVSIPDYLDRRTQAAAIEEATLFTTRSISLVAGGQPEQLRALAVTPSFFATLGRQPMLGRGFTESEATPNADKFVILSYGVWASRFGADRTLVGRDVRLNGEAYRVVGVLPADLTLPSRDIAALVPFAFTPQQMSDEGRGNEFSSMIARLRPGATIEQLDAQMKVIVSRNLERLPQYKSFATTSGFSGIAVDLRQQLVGDLRTPLFVLQAGVLAVLLIACVNVANLLLMRATGRYRELAIRTTLGAGQWRLVRQLVTEAIVLALLGGAGGVMVGILGVRALLGMTSQQLPSTLDGGVHLPVLAFTLGVALLTGLIFGLVPALAVIRGNTSALLKDDSTRGSASRGTSLMRSTLVVAEIALALVLLIGAGLLVRSFAGLQRVDPGFTAENVLTAQLSLPPARYADIPARGAFWQRLMAKARELPGVSSLGLTSNVPFNGMVSSGSYSIVGYTPPPGQPSPHGRQEVVGGDYFAAMHIPLVKGRLFTDGDTPASAPVVVIDEYLVKKYFTDRDPIGQQIQRGDVAKITIVGVVGTIRAIDLGEPVTKERLYYPVAQIPRASMALVLKTALDPTTLVGQVRSAVQTLDSEQPIAEVRTMDQWVARSLDGRRTPMVLLTLFGAVALLLSAIGIYGVLAFGVAQRVREFGIRQALGADRANILALVLKQGMATAAVGIAIGLVAAAVLTKYLSALLVGVSPHDGAVFAAVPVILLAVAAVACYLPARRATAVDPMIALRET